VPQHSQLVMRSPRADGFQNSVPGQSISHKEIPMTRFTNVGFW
jgi:hypothetical protein